MWLDLLIFFSGGETQSLASPKLPHQQIAWAGKQGQAMAPYPAKKISRYAV